MRSIRKALCLTLILSLVITVCACKKNDKKNDKDSSSSYSDVNSGYSSNTEEGYNSEISDWKEEAQQNQNNTNQSFDNNINGTNPTPKPGNSNTVSTVTNKNPHEDLPESLLTNKNNLQYYYEGNNYAYGITNQGNEYIAFRDESGRLYDVMNGGGKIQLVNVSRATVLSLGSVTGIERTMQDAYDSVKVSYNIILSGASDAKVTTTYVFKENCISYSTQVSVSSNSVISSDNSSLIRGFVNNYIDCDAAVHEQWVYPSNGDYPYPDFESFAVEHQIDETLWCYSFLRGDGVATYYQLDNWNTPNLPCEFENANGLLYSLSYDIAFVDTATEGEERDYLGLFKSFNSDFAAGIAPITDTGDNSTIFEGDEAELNINVTNLTEDDLTFSLRYDIRDYYGNVVDAGIFIDSNVYKYSEANRKITVKVGNYGMYYLNLYVISRYSTYSECYPFALLEEYTYKYSDTSPFGIATSNHGNDEQTYIDTAHLMAKCGVANMRLNGNDINLRQADELIKLGINNFNGAYNPVNDSALEVDNYVENVLAKVAKLDGYIDSMEVGNEMSLEAQKVGGRPLEQLYPLFYNYTYMPTYRAIKEKYPHLKYIPCPFSACEQSWINMFSEGFVDNDNDGFADFDSLGNLIRNSENASWKQVEIVATHIYGNPWMPDQYASYVPGYGAGMWIIEAGMQRMEEMFNKHRDQREGDDPDFYLTEVGYPTPPASSASVCLRTQADYTARIGVICAAYGVDRIQYYCLTDRTSAFSGFRQDNGEWNFGLCYEQDYYGIIKPKPAMIAFAVMTRQLESVKKDGAEISEKYDEGWDVGGVRAYEFDTALHGKVIVAYSNKQVLSNGKKNSTGSTGDRTPTLPWNTLWTETDNTEFETAQSSVTVVDTMGNKKTYKAENGKVVIPLTGETVYIFGVK